MCRYIFVYLITSSGSNDVSSLKSADSATSQCRIMYIIHFIFFPLWLPNCSNEGLIIKHVFSTCSPTYISRHLTFQYYIDDVISLLLHLEQRTIIFQVLGVFKYFKSFPLVPLVCYAEATSKRKENLLDDFQFLWLRRQQ